MKILHVNNFAYPDYLNDMVYHGGRELLGDDWEASSPPNYMCLDHLPSKHTLYGRGFSLYCRLKGPAAQDDPKAVEQKIRDRHYDRIVYGSATRCMDHMDLVFRNYKPHEIALIDGEDHNGAYWAVVQKGRYFKRELVNDDPRLHPIGFGIPKDLFRQNVPKVQVMATCVPGDPRTYVFHDEGEYHLDYAKSHFGQTCKKAGWDCLRHYEILANFCMPHFPDLHRCPRMTMTNFPKDVVEGYRKRHGTRVTPELMPAMDQADEHARKHCTTEAVAKYVLERLQ